MRAAEGHFNPCSVVKKVDRCRIFYLNVNSIVPLTQPVTKSFTTHVFHPGLGTVVVYSAVKLKLKLEISTGYLSLLRDEGDIKLQKGTVHLIAGIAAEVEVGRAAAVGVRIIAVDKSITLVGTIE